MTHAIIDYCPVCRAPMKRSEMICPRWDDRAVHLKGYRKGEWPTG